MRNRVMASLLVVACLSLVLAAGPSQAVSAPDAESVTWFVVAGGGAVSMTAEGYSAGTTIGQAATGWSENGHGLGSGFWYGVSYTGVYRIYLPLVARQ